MFRRRVGDIGVIGMCFTMIFPYWRTRNCCAFSRFCLFCRSQLRPHRPWSLALRAATRVIAIAPAALLAEYLAFGRGFLLDPSKREREGRGEEVFIISRAKLFNNYHKVNPFHIEKATLNFSSSHFVFVFILTEKLLPFISFPFNQFIYFLFIFALKNITGPLTIKEQTNDTILCLLRELLHEDFQCKS